MRLFEAILEANHRAVTGDSSAGVRVADYANELPVVALTCIDPRLNRFFPGVMGLPEEQFIWLRNAGNILTGPLSSTMRSIALACAVKGGREVAVIGHTDCQICKTTVSWLTDRFKALGIDRQQLPENLTEYFGLFASERQNVIKCVDIIRHSPLIGPKVPVHGLLVDVQTGRLEWIVNGYDALDRAAPPPPPRMEMPSIGASVGQSSASAGFDLGEMKFPEMKIGEGARQAGWQMAEIKRQADPIGQSAPVPAPPPIVTPPPAPPPPPARTIPAPPRGIPVPPPIRMHPDPRTRRR